VYLARDTYAATNQKEHRDMSQFESDQNEPNPQTESTVDSNLPENPERRTVLQASA
jgi:hypothetical protein